MSTYTADEIEDEWYLGAIEEGEKWKIKRLTDKKRTDF